MPNEKRIALSLLFLRLGVFIVMFMWTLDKFVNPSHAMKVYAHFYFLKDVGVISMTIIGAVEIAIVVAFVLGYRKTWTYGAVLVFHAISTFSSYNQYLAPFAGPNLLFFAAWPMLAACLALFLLRDMDTKWTVGKG